MVHLLFSTLKTRIIITNPRPNFNEVKAWISITSHSFTLDVITYPWPNLDAGSPSLVEAIPETQRIHTFDVVSIAYDRSDI